MGLYIDNRLSWSSHISNLTKKLSKTNFLLRRLASSTTFDVLRMVYFACFYSRMSYCIIVWGSSTLSETVFKIQKSSIRIICGLGYRDSCRGFFKKVRTLTLPSLYILTLLVDVKARAHTLPCRSDVHGYNTRRQTELEINHCRLTKTQSTDPDQIGIRMYNFLPTSLKELPTSQFQRKLKKILEQEELYSIQDFWQLDFKLLHN